MGQSGEAGGGGTNRGGGGVCCKLYGSRYRASTTHIEHMLVATWDRLGNKTTVSLWIMSRDPWSHAPTYDLLFLEGYRINNAAVQSKVKRSA